MSQNAIHTVRAVACLSALVALLFSPASGQAQTQPDPEPTGTESEQSEKTQPATAPDPTEASGEAPEPPPMPDEMQPVEWQDHWTRFQTWEYVVGPTLLAGGFAMRFLGPEPPDNWREENAVDREINNAVAVRTQSGRTAVSLMGDIGFGASMGYRFVDSLLLPGLVHDNWDVSLQMSMIDIQAFGIVAAVLWGSQLAVGRSRPWANSCRKERLDPEKISVCDGVDGGNARRSFIAGHTATAVTGAALTCLHHDRMPLYGGGAGDAAACGTAVGVAAVTTVARQLSESHYFTDNLMGITLGLLAGWVMPSALHYGFFEDDEADEALLEPDPEDAESEVELTLAPTAQDSGAGVMVLGRW